MRMKKQLIRKIIKTCIVIVSIVLLIIIIIKSTIAKEVVSLIFISFIVAYILKPIHVKLVGRGLNNKFSGILLISLIVLIFFALFAFLIPSVLRESMSLNYTISKLQSIADGFYDNIKFVKNNKIFYIISDNVNGKINKYTRSMAENIMNSIFKLGENVLSLFVVPIISYYFLTDGYRIENFILIAFPIRIRNMVKKILIDIDKVMGRYMSSQFLLCAIIGIFTFFILVFLHVDFPVLLSILNAFFNIIPYFGPIFGAVPAIIMALMESPKTAVYTTLWLYVLQLVEGNILSPKITGDSVSMHPLTVILLLIIGEKFAGFLGMVLAVPIGVIAKIIYEDMNYYLF